ncbi:MAG: hypothetical protein R3284_10530 [Rubricoccaceae bacterium]|nr:hypothetical protein [Rubricoccaceae bacterium]
MRRWISALSVVLILATTCIASADTDSSAADIEAPVKQFLQFYFHEYKRGLPGESQLPDLASFVTPQLLDLFEAAIKGENCYMEKNNYEGPSPVQGDLFSSLFEGGTSATYQLVDQKAGKATYEIEWTNDSEYAGSEPFVWKDRVIVVETGDGWLIADFAHLGTWDFMMKGDVSQILQSVANECSD